MSEVQDAQRERNRHVWSIGDWDEVSKLIASVGPKLLDRAGVDAGERLLDVGTGSGGTIAIPAAQRGAKVTGSDLTDTWFDAGRRRAEQAGVEVDWVVADAQELPFADGEFDIVTSTFGHMFAPDHAAAGRELARVVKPGGTVATACWIPDGSGGRFFATIGSHLPKPPEGFQPPPLWGSEDHAREMLEPHGLELEFERETVSFEDESAAGLVDLYERSFGPVIAAKESLGDGFTALRDDLLALFDEINQADGGNFRVEFAYLVTIGRKKG